MIETVQHLKNAGMKRGHGNRLKMQKNDFSSDQESDVLKALQYDKEAFIEANSQLTHKFYFRPTKEMKMNVTLLVYFKNFLETKPIMITIKGQCIKVPSSQEVVV